MFRLIAFGLFVCAWTHEETMDDNFRSLFEVLDKILDAKITGVMTQLQEHSHWSSWLPWEACSVSCDVGIQSRRRTCSNQQSNLYASICNGDSVDYRVCRLGACDAHSVAFTATYMFNESSRVSIKFKKVPVNYGNAYSSSTGEFTCTIPGLYAFAVTLSRRKSYGNVHAYLKVRGSTSASLTLFGQISGSYPLSAAGSFYLNQNDVVYIDGNPSYFRGGTYSFFSGFLIKPDQ